MTSPRLTDAFPRHACGCPTEGYKFPYRCRDHAAMDWRIMLPDVRQDDWYGENTCPFCGRVNPYGLACDRAEMCALCGIVSCASHGQATYRSGTICPRNINPRTKVGKQFLAALRGIGARP